MACCGFCGTAGFIFSDQLPPTPTDQDSIAEACELRRLLRTEGVNLRRINSKMDVAHKRVVLIADGSGLEYSPCSKNKRQYLLFADLCDVSVEDPNTKTYRKTGLNAQQDCIINFRTRSGTQWRLVYDSLAEAQRWLAFIGYQRSKTYNARIVEDTLEGRIQAMFHRADADHNGTLSLKEARKLMVSLNVSMDKSTLKSVFKKYDTSGDGSLDLEEFTELFRILTDRPDLRPIFHRFAKQPEKGMSLEDFREFCTYQKESPVYGELVFSSLEPNREGYIAFQSFVNYLLDTNVNGPIKAKHRAGVVDDMSFSLKDYFINSSHNTYLSGNQLNSGSNVDMYKMALRSGCRCVELDCWDGPKKEPVIYHGHTRTSKILFVDALKSIHRYAFEVSPYPVILSLEVHTSEKQTNKLATHLKNIFGPLLLKASELDEGTYTPENLKHRIIVKGKMKSSDIGNYDDDDEESYKDGMGEILHATESSTNLSPCVGMSAHHTSDWGRTAKVYNVQSYSENKIDSFTPEEQEKFILQNTRMISRIYPKGSRISSSNYNPSPSWALGAQLVALNYQTWDEGMRMNDGMFCQNSCCGYVLKPLFLREPLKAKPTSYTLEIRVICGAQLPKPNLEKKGDIVDPYVVLLINGGLTWEARTNTIMNNGLKPHWDTSFTFTGGCLELDILSLRVMDGDSTSADDEVCEASVPLRCMRQGYRSFAMKLCSTGVRVQAASLLCHIKVVPHNN
eukprot:gene6026-4329_t